MSTFQIALCIDFSWNTKLNSLFAIKFRPYNMSVKRNFYSIDVRVSSRCAVSGEFKIFIACTGSYLNIYISVTQLWRLSIKRIEWKPGRWAFEGSKATVESLRRKNNNICLSFKKNLQWEMYIQPICSTLKFGISVVLPVIKSFFLTIHTTTCYYIY